MARKKSNFHAAVMVSALRCEWDRPPCPQEPHCRCFHLSSKTLVWVMDICSQAHMYSPGQLCCNLLGWQELHTCSSLRQEVALWAAGPMSLAQTLCRKHCSGKRGMEEVALNHVKAQWKIQQSLLSAYLRVPTFWWRPSPTTLFT